MEKGTYNTQSGMFKDMRIQRSGGCISGVDMGYGYLPEVGKRWNMRSAKVVLFLFTLCLCMRVNAYSSSEPLWVSTDSLNCYLTYPVGQNRVTVGFGNNAAELARLDTFLHRLLADSLLTVRSVRLTAYSSVDGPYVVNQRLAEARARSMKQYLDRHCGLSALYPVSVHSVAEDWDSLCNLVVTSVCPWHDEIASVIARVPDYDTREKLLRKLDGGAAFSYLKKYVFPKLRRVEVQVEYDRRKAIEQRVAMEKMVLAPHCHAASPLCHAEFAKDLPAQRKILHYVQDDKDESRHDKEEGQHDKEAPRRFSLSTNLLADAGVAISGNRSRHRAPMPNLALEFFFGKRWSVQGSALYANWNDPDGNLWATTAFRLEPRFWLSAPGAYRGFYLGAYGQAGSFDVQSGEWRTGWYAQGGLSAGYYLPFSCHWGMGVGVRGGYEQADTEYYSLRGNVFRRIRKATRRRWGLTGAEVTLNWRF